MPSDMAQAKISFADSASKKDPTSPPSGSLKSTSPRHTGQEMPGSGSATDFHSLQESYFSSVNFEECFLPPSETIECLDEHFPSTIPYGNPSDAPLNIPDELPAELDQGEGFLNTNEEFDVASWNRTVPSWDRETDIIASTGSASNQHTPISTPDPAMNAFLKAQPSDFLEMPLNTDTNNTYNVAGEAGAMHAPVNFPSLEHENIDTTTHLSNVYASKHGGSPVAVQTDDEAAQMQQASMPQTLPLNTQPLQRDTSKPKARLSSMRHRKEYDEAGNYVDRTLHTITQEAFNSLKPADASTSKGPTVRVEIGKGGPQHIINVDRVHQQGIGAHIFCCPDPQCSQVFVRRNIIERHFSRMHEDLLAQGMSWKSHPTVATFAYWGTARPDYKRRPRKVTEAEKKKHGKVLTREKRKAIALEENEESVNTPVTGGADLNDRPKKAPHINHAREIQPHPMVPATPPSAPIASSSHQMLSGLPQNVSGGYPTYNWRLQAAVLDSQQVYPGSGPQLFVQPGLDQLQTDRQMDSDRQDYGQFAAYQQHDWDEGQYH